MGMNRSETTTDEIRPQMVTFMERIEMNWRRGGGEFGTTSRVAPISSMLGILRKLSFGGGEVNKKWD
jgi:hypothetical protein